MNAVRIEAAIGDSGSPICETSRIRLAVEKVEIVLADEELCVVDWIDAQVVQLGTRQLRAWTSLAADGKHLSVLQKRCSVETAPTVKRRGVAPSAGRWVIEFRAVGDIRKTVDEEATGNQDTAVGK